MVVYPFQLSSQMTGIFRHWLQNPNQNMFWISGKPGSGKSALTHYLSTEIKDYSPTNVVLVSAFIWTSGGEL